MGKAILNIENKATIMLEKIFIKKYSTRYNREIIVFNPLGWLNKKNKITTSKNGDL